MLNEQSVQDIVKEVIAKMSLGEQTQTGMGIFTDMNEAIAAAKKAQAVLRRMSMDQREKIITRIRQKINENAETARSAGGYPPDVPHQFREFRSSMLSSGRQTASILIRLVLPDLPFVMPPVITTLSPGCRCIVSRAARSA